MEVIREDFRVFISQVRRTLDSLESELTSAKARDDLECALRILTLFEAEFDYLSASQTTMAAELDAVEAALGEALRSDELAALSAGLVRIATAAWTAPQLQLAARRNLFQAEIPQIAHLADGGSAEAACALALLLGNESRQFARVQALRDEKTLVEHGGAGEMPAPAGGGVPNISNAALEVYLREKFPEETGLTIAKADNLPGGRSKQTTLISLAGTTTLPSRIVMRADIPGGLVPSRAVDEFAIIAIADRHGVPVPKPLLCEPDASRLGRSFILVSAVPGATEGEYFPEMGPGVKDKPGIGRQLARILARINSIPVSELAGTHINPDVDLLALVEATIDNTYQQARGFDNPSRMHLEMAYHWLKQNIHLAQDVPCLIHCDVGLHNIMIENGKITAMLDWELATMASPAREISKIFHLIDYLMPREDFFAAYIEAGGPPNAIEPARMNFYAVMNYMVTNQRARYASHLFATGKQANIVLANAGYDSYYRNVTLLSNALARAMQG